MDINLAQLELSTEIYQTLLLHAPVLSGNLLSHLNMIELSQTESIIEIQAKHYNVSTFKRTGMISYDGKGDYAIPLNMTGAFGNGGRDVGWVNVAVMTAIYGFAFANGATIIDLG